MEVYVTREPLKPKKELLKKYKNNKSSSKEFFEVELDKRDLLHELRIQTARANRLQEATNDLLQQIITVLRE